MVDFQSETLDARDGQVEVFAKVAAVPAQLVTVELELVEPTDRGVGRAGIGRALVLESRGDVGPSDSG